MNLTPQQEEALAKMIEQRANNMLSSSRLNDPLSSPDFPPIDDIQLIIQNIDKSLANKSKQFNISSIL